MFEVFVRIQKCWTDIYQLEFASYVLIWADVICPMKFAKNRGAISKIGFIGRKESQFARIYRRRLLFSLQTGTVKGF